MFITKNKFDINAIAQLHEVVKYAVTMKDRYNVDSKSIIMEARQHVKY